MIKTAALTGATGFIGAALIERLQDDGFAVRVLARSPDKLKAHPAAERLEIIKGDLEDADALSRLAEGADAFIHAAGLTLARRDQDYQSVNVDGARAAAVAAASANARFVHLSSLSAREPALSPYAASKRASEAAVADVAPAAAMLRLPAIYGPRDTVTLPFFKMVNSGWAPQPASETPGRFSILYVADAADAVAHAAASASLQGVFEVGDAARDGHTWTELGETLGAAFGRTPKTLRLPRSVLAIFNRASIATARAFSLSPTARTGQINEFFHPDWVARERLFNDLAAWTPQTDLQEGFAKTIQWYQDNGYL